VKNLEARRSARGRSGWRRRREKRRNIVRQLEDFVGTVAVYNKSSRWKGILHKQKRARKKNKPYQGGIERNPFSSLAISRNGQGDVKTAEEKKKR